jgi:ubiquinone/menaquinone biosynthesis C-methylase UbiE
MPETLADIHCYWQRAAQTELDADGLRPTVRDEFLQQAVESAIEKWIWPGCALLDIGFGDGHSTLRFAKRAGSVLGVDYVREFVDRATTNAAKAQADNTRFVEGDVTNLRSAVGDATFDIAVTIRCLINLPTWELQRLAVKQICQALKQGGIYLLSEGWQEGWDNIDRLRRRAGLDLMRRVEHNTLLSRARFEQLVSQDFEIVAYQSLGFYLVMSRVFQPAFVAPDEPKHLHPINKTAAMLYCRGIGTEAFKEYDYAGVYVLRKR